MVLFVVCIETGLAQYYDYAYYDLEPVPRPALIGPGGFRFFSSNNFAPKTYYDQRTNHISNAPVKSAGTYSGT